jgi:hypothetical protein
MLNQCSATIADSRFTYKASGRKENRDKLKEKLGKKNLFGEDADRQRWACGGFLGKFPAMGLPR